jgi:hypothetical protein
VTSQIFNSALTNSRFQFLISKLEFHLMRRFEIWRLVVDYVSTSVSKECPAYFFTGLTVKIEESRCSITLTDSGDCRLIRNVGTRPCGVICQNTKLLIFSGTRTPAGLGNVDESRSFLH